MHLGWIGEQGPAAPQVHFYWTLIHAVTPVVPIFEGASKLVKAMALAPEDTEPYPMSYITANEMKSALHWFSCWSHSQRERFLQDLVAKAVPGKICLLLEGLGRLGMDDQSPNIFQCQLRLWDQWFANWTEDERNEFLRRLEECDPNFVARFYKEVAGTAGKD
ncbi:uncharacterized protein C14orf119 homolog isoform X1 [Pleurodeles waltl]|uniref:uncharacterized protein C14orf119 homolog isoform X1 n=1 Tax=Pleurodeles waltl TaxID=8319 RepID=UPI0037096CA0